MNSPEQIIAVNQTTDRDGRPTSAPRREPAEAGWALLGLILALMVLGVLLVSAAPSVKLAVQRDKEAELIYRGNQMAEAIGRYYNSGQRGAPQLMVPPARFGGFLLELKKLRDGITVGENRIKFVRRSAMIDPMSNEEWEVVRFRDARLAPFLQAYAGATGNLVPPVIQLLAGPPPKLVRLTPTTILPGGGTTQGNTNRAPTAPGSGTRPGEAVDPDADNDDDDDDDDAAPDPLGHLLKDKDSDQPGKSSLPIVGVAPKLKGPSVRALYGLTNYEQWVFIFIPDPQTMPNGITPGIPVTPTPNRNITRPLP